MSVRVVDGGVWERERNDALNNVFLHLVTYWSANTGTIVVVIK